MSHPLYNGGLVGALTDDLRPRLADDGNWSLQGTSEQPTHRSLFLLVNGVPVFGFYPTWISEPFQTAIDRPGCFTRRRALEWVGPTQLRPGDGWEIRMKAGVRYVGWADSAGQDAMEWGSGDPRDSGAADLLATTGLLIVPGLSGSPQPQPLLEKLAETAAAVEVEMGLATAKSFAGWKADNPGEAAAVTDYLGAVLFGERPAPPDLKTHVGRALSGVAQNGVTCQVEL